jgi:hypothetical protein
MGLAALRKPGLRSGWYVNEQAQEVAQGHAHHRGVATGHCLHGVEACMLDSVRTSLIQWIA